MSAPQNVPPPPNYPPSASPSDAWWDALYDEPHAQEATGRLLNWWSRKPGPTTPTELSAAEGDEPSADGEAAPPTEADETARPTWFQPAPDYYPRPHVPALPEVRAPVAFSEKSKAGLYNAAAAGAGWGLGLLDLLRGWITECGAEFSVGGALVLGVGGCLAIAHVWDRRTRLWWNGIAWAARIPLATAVLAVALYAPASQL